MPITALDVVGGVSSVLKSRKKRRKERRKKRRAKEKAKAMARDNFNAGFNPAVESTSEALGGISGKSGDTDEGNGNNNTMMYVIGAILVYMFFLRK